MGGIKRNEANGPDESTVRGKTKKPKTLGKYLLVPQRKPLWNSDRSSYCICYRAVFCRERRGHHAIGFV